MRVLLQPPTVYGGSLGDQAMIYGAARAICDIDGQQSTVDLLVPQQHQHRWTYLDSRVRMVSAPDYKSYDEVILIGADCVDNAYGTSETYIIRQVAEQGIPTRIVSFSLRPESEKDGTQDILRRLAELGTRFCPRDPASYTRLLSLIGMDKKPQVRQAADLAFLCSTAAATAAICEALRKDVVPVAVCVRYDSKRLQLVARLLQQSPRVLPIFVPHDLRNPRDIDGCFQVQHLIDRPDALIVNTTSSEIVRGVVSLCEFAITERTHLAIACMSMGVPAIAFRYNGKVLGILTDMGVSNLAVDDPADCETAWYSLLRDYDRDKMEQNLKLRLPRVLSLAFASLQPFT